MIESNNVLGLYFDTPSPMTSNVEPIDEAETPIKLSPLSMVDIESLRPSVSVPLEFPDGEDNAHRLPENSSPHKLCVTFGGKFGRQVPWENIMPSVDQLIKRCASDTTHSLTVVLEPSSTPDDRWNRGRTLKRLFNCLGEEPVIDTDGRQNIACSVFNRISVTVPDFSGHAITNDDPESIGITSASNLREFLCKGPSRKLANFLYPANGLTLLSITGCRISVDDAVELLQPCSSLEEVQLETVQGTKAVEALTPKPRFKFNLIKLSVTSSVNLAPMLELIEWAWDEAELNITFLDNGTQDENALSSGVFFPQRAVLKLTGKFLEDTIKRLRAMRQ